MVLQSLVDLRAALIDDPLDEEPATAQDEKDTLPVRSAVAPPVMAFLAAPHQGKSKNALAGSLSRSTYSHAARRGPTPPRKRIGPFGTSAAPTPHRQRPADWVKYGR